MKKSRIQISLVCLALLLSAAAAEVLVPRASMAQSTATLDLETLIPKQLSHWAPVPDIRIVEPPGSDTLSHEIYSQEIARGYADHEGHVVMLLIAYGASQSDRLQLHRPEICYAAQGFRVSRPVWARLTYQDGSRPTAVTRLVAQREGRLEPVTYWMRIGNDVATGVVERQILKVTYGLKGLIPDGALIRVSTVGLPEGAAFALEDQFVHDLLSSSSVAARRFLLGSPEKALAPSF